MRAAIGQSPDKLRLARNDAPAGSRLVQNVGMPFRLTPHARARIAERSVEPEWLDAVLTRPQRVLPAQAGREERQGVFERDGKRVLLRVIVEGDIVITAIVTSKLDKYGA